MRQFAWASVVVAAFGMGSAQVATAADLPVKAQPMAAVASNWTGCYFGANVGTGWTLTSQTQIAKVGGPAVVPNNDFGSSTGSGAVGGLQIGCDYQPASAPRWVFGVRGMWDLASIQSSHVVPTAFIGFPVGSFISQNRTKTVATVTGRVGYVVHPTVLAYVNGGGAWAQMSHVFIGTVPSTFVSETASGTRQGWTIGTGVEWMFKPGWSVFAEFNYMDFGRKDVSFVNGPGTVGLPDVVSSRMTIEQVLVGLNRKFNWRS